jgi:tetratricopeptide (TPR) repeat protein
LEAQPEAFQTFLRRSAVYRQPVLKEGIRLVCDDLKDWDLQAEKAVRLSLMEEDSTRIDYVQYWVTPLLRGDIFAELGEEERRRCHKTAVSYYQGILSKSRSHAPISGEELIEHALKAGLDEVTIEEGGRLLHYLHNTPAYEKALAQGRYILSHVSKPKIDESTEHCKNRLALLGTTEISRDTLNLKKSDFLYELGSVEKALGKWEDAKLHLEECIELVEKVKDPDRIARSCNQLGDVLYRTGTLEDAFKYFDRALEISKTQKRWGRVTSILDRFRTYYRLQKESDKIIEKFDECLKLCSESNDLRSMANMMTGMARAYIDIGNYEMALAKLDGSIKIWDKLKEDRYLNYKAEILERNRAETLERRGDALKAMGRWDESLRLYEVVYQIKKQLGDVLGETGLLNVIAATLQQAERYTLAVEKHEESLKIVRETRAVVLLTMILTIGGSIYRELENWHKALQRYEECYQVGKEIGYLSAEGGGLMGMGEVYMRQGNLKGALIKFQDSLEIWKDLKRESEIGVISQKLGKLHLKLGEYDRAYEFAIQANEILETSSFTIGGIIHLGKAKLSLAEVCLAQKKYKKAFAIIKQARDIFDKLRLSHLQREAGQLERNVNPKTQPCLSCIFNDRKHPEKQFS